MVEIDTQMSEENKQKLKEYQKIIVKLKDRDNFQYYADVQLNNK